MHLRPRMRMARRALGAMALRACGPSAVGALSRSWKLERLDTEHHDAVLASPAAIFALWHGRLLLPLVAHAEQTFTILVSPSDDGSLVAGLLEHFGQRVVRGSSNKTPARALRTLRRELDAGRRIVLTPDGPRGPRHQVNSGAAWLAARTGAPILSLGLGCDRAWQLSSWDRFTIPKPGARVVVAYGEPLFVERGATPADLDAASEDLRQRLSEAEARAAAHLTATSDRETA